ncbi:MAG: dienelactone hydrolase family protein [Bacteroidetes bacterium]|nr:dienelactone hydrolase family protein [Bacteroidota bacterium]
MLFPRTEGNMSPDHEAFGGDLSFLAGAIQEENNNSSSVFYGVISGKTAIMGHSMGGGAAFLASRNNNEITTLVTFAAAETTPSAITSASEVYVPSLVFSGSEDCVEPEEDNQNPMYDSLSSSCKVQISIINGGHCYFGNYSFNCTLGESTCLPVVPLSRAEQQQTTLIISLTD